MWIYISSKKITFGTKVHALMHLGNSSMFFFVIIVAILSVPMLYIKSEYETLNLIFKVGSLFMVSTVILFINNWFVYKSIQTPS